MDCSHGRSFAKNTKKIAGPLAQKQKVVEAIIKGGGDRPQAAYDELKNKASSQLKEVLDSTEEEQLSRTILRLLAKHKISWTNEHFALAKGVARPQADLKKENQVPASAALAQDDWNVPVAQAPSRTSRALSSPRSPSTTRSLLRSGARASSARRGLWPS